MAMPMDAYRKDDSFLLRLDLPGVKPNSIDLTVEDNVLTVKAERPAAPPAEGIESVIAERPFGSFSRQVVLGTNLDLERIEADYEAGVLTVVIPVAEKAKPRRIEVTRRSDQQQITAT
jgi:HSP20 family protein